MYLSGSGCCHIECTVQATYTGGVHDVKNAELFVDNTNAGPHGGCDGIRTPSAVTERRTSQRKEDTEDIREQRKGISASAGYHCSTCTYFFLSVTPHSLKHSVSG